MIKSYDSLDASKVLLCMMIVRLMIVITHFLHHFRGAITCPNCQSTQMDNEN
ncbi:MAG: hypothetical protein ABI210_09295 [Abditibacteriaceae bacterium]